MPNLVRYAAYSGLAGGFCGVSALLGYRYTSRGLVPHPPPAYENTSPLARCVPRALCPPASGHGMCSSSRYVFLPPAYCRRACSRATQWATPWKCAGPTATQCGCRAQSSNCANMGASGLSRWAPRAILAVLNRPTQHRPWWRARAHTCVRVRPRGAGGGPFQRACSRARTVGQSSRSPVRHPTAPSSPPCCDIVVSAGRAIMMRTGISRGGCSPRPHPRARTHSVLHLSRAVCEKKCDFGCILYYFKRVCTGVVSDKVAFSAAKPVIGFCPNGDMVLPKCKFWGQFGCIQNRTSYHN